ncbi:hypothetical protein D3C76_1480460 [compost metagenome]
MIKHDNRSDWAEDLFFQQVSASRHIDQHGRVVEVTNTIWAVPPSQNDCTFGYCVINQRCNLFDGACIDQRATLGFRLGAIVYA